MLIAVDYTWLYKFKSLSECYSLKQPCLHGHSAWLKGWAADTKRPAQQSSLSVSGSSTSWRPLYSRLPCSVSFVNLGHFNCNVWLKARPKVKLWRFTGNFTLSRLWLKWVPNVNSSRLWGKVTCSRLWLKNSPKVKLRREGKTTLSTVSLKRPPNLRVWRCGGNVTKSKGCLKRCPNFNLATGI